MHSFIWVQCIRPLFKKRRKAHKNTLGCASQKVALNKEQISIHKNERSAVHDTKARSAVQDTKKVEHLAMHKNQLAK